MPQRIASLLPSATDALFAMGLGDQVVAVSHACSVPEEAAARPAAVRTRVTEATDQAAIDAQVQKLVEAGEPLYVVDEGVLHHVQPDLVVAQETCQVCGAGPADVQAALLRIEPADRPEILSLHAHTLEDALDGMRALARQAGAPEAGDRLIDGLRARLDRVAELAGRAGARPRVAVLDWLDPPMAAGHWVPELVDLAGGEPCLVQAGAPSRYVEPDEVLAAEPEVLIAAPCGLELDQARRDTAPLLGQAPWSELPAVATGRVHALDAARFLSRPGPSLATAAELLGLALHPDLFHAAYPEHLGKIPRVG